MRSRAAVVLLALLTLGLAGASSTGAAFTSRSEVDATMTTPAWLYLRNRPTPPTGSTSAQSNLAMDAVRPVQPLLFKYDPNRDSLPRPRIRRGGAGAGDTHFLAVS